MEFSYLIRTSFHHNHVTIAFFNAFFLQYCSFCQKNAIFVRYPQPNQGFIRSVNNSLREVVGKVYQCSMIFQVQFEKKVLGLLKSSFVCLDKQPSSHQVFFQQNIMVTKGFCLFGTKEFQFNGSSSNRTSSKTPIVLWLLKKIGKL